MLHDSVKNNNEFFSAIDSFHTWIGWHIPFSMMDPSAIWDLEKASQTYAGMRGPKSRSRVSGFCFDHSHWAPEGPPSRISNFKDPQRSEQNTGLLFSEIEQVSSRNGGKQSRLVGWKLYCIIMDRLMFA